MVSYLFLVHFKFTEESCGTLEKPAVVTFIVFGCDANIFGNQLLESYHFNQQCIMTILNSKGKYNMKQLTFLYII